MTVTPFTRIHVGYTGGGAPLYEYRLEGTPYVICRMYPDRGRDGWSIYNEETDSHEYDAWTLWAAKKIVRIKTNKEEK